MFYEFVLLKLQKMLKHLQTKMQQFTKQRYKRKEKLILTQLSI